MDDQLILLKINYVINYYVINYQLLSYVAGTVEPFLKTYQTDNTKMPYLYLDLKAIVKQLLELIVENNLNDACRPGRQLKEINLEDNKNLLSLEKMNIGFAVELLLKKMKKSDFITISRINDFKREA